jgi:hypothetical protein
VATLLAEALLDQLDQELVWRTADRRVIPLEQMEATHRMAVLRMLVQMAPDLYATWLTEGLPRLADDEGFDPHALVEWSERDREVARRWLERRPLVIRLRDVHRAAWLGRPR